MRTEQLAKAGRAVPHEQNGLRHTDLPSDSDDEDLSTLGDRLAQGRAHAETKSGIFNQNLEVAYRTYASQRTTNFTSKLQDAISKLPRALRNGPYVVKADESVHEKVFQNIKGQIDASFNNTNPESTRPTSAGFIYLTHEQVQRYEPYLQGDEYVLPAEIVAQRLPQIIRWHAGRGGRQ